MGSFFVSLLLLPLLLSSSFALSQDAFSMDLTTDQLFLSYAAYCPENQILDWSCFFCTNYSHVSTTHFTPVATVYNETTDIFGYVGYTGTIAQVIFRGTRVQSLPNWIDDLNFAHATPYPDIPNAYVHSGFYESWLSVKPLVIAALKEVYTKITPTEFYFSGHSLGAAVSVLAATDIGASLDVPITCYNYGDPRVGNQVFAEFFNAHINTVYRIVNQNDVVPHLPTKQLGFWHIATEVWWMTSSSYKICDSTGEDPTCSDSLLVALSIEKHLDYLNVSLRAGHPSGCM